MVQDEMGLRSFQKNILLGWEATIDRLEKLHRIEI